MVIRGAYGISNFTESTGTGNLLIQNPPFAVPLNVTYAGGTLALPGSTLDQGFSGFPASGCTVAAALAQSPLCFLGTGIHAFDPNNIRPAVSQQYNLTVQHQLGNSSTFQISYVGQKTDHLMTIALINQKVLEPGGLIAPSPYLNPTLLALIGQARLTHLGRLFQLQRAADQLPASSQPGTGIPGQLHLVQVHGQLLGLLCAIRRHQCRSDPGRQQPLLLPEHLQPRSRLRALRSEHHERLQRLRNLRPALRSRPAVWQRHQSRRRPGPGWLAGQLHPAVPQRLPNHRAGLR